VSRNKIVIKKEITADLRKGNTDELLKDLVDEQKRNILRTDVSPGRAYYQEY